MSTESINDPDLENFLKADITDVPALAFCIPEVINSYGLCPYLSLPQASHRDSWLQTTHDHGHIYKEMRDRVLHGSQKHQLHRERECKKKELEDHVETCLQEKGFVTPADYVERNGPVSPIEYLVSSVQYYQTIKSRNKPVRQQWQQVQEYMDKILTETGINFTKFLKLVYDVHVRYRIPSQGLELNNAFEKLCEQYIRYDNQVATEENFIQKREGEAKKKLSMLLKRNFSMQQHGKYFKRWSMLTDEQKTERLSSFSTWFCREHNSDEEDELLDYLQKCIENKSLKSTCIKWSSKTGIISTVDGLEYDAEKQKFNITPVQRSVKRVQFVEQDSSEEVTNTAERETDDKKKSVVGKRPQKKKITFSPSEEARLNRLLLYHILTSPIVTKAVVLKDVSSSFTDNSTVKTKVTTWLGPIFDKMIEVIKERPMK